MPLELFKYPSPVIDNGEQGSYDEGYLGEPVVIVTPAAYEMWYEAIKYPPYDAGHHRTIAYASSTDGVRWAKDPAKQFLPNPDYPWCSTTVLEPWCFRDGGRYRLYFTCNEKLTDLGYAESYDGIHWQNYRLLLSAPDFRGIGIHGDQLKGVSEASVIKRAERDYVMYFQAETVSDYDHIGYALSTDGVAFSIPVDKKGNHTPAWSSRDAWQDVRGLAGPCVIRHRGLYYLFCNTWSAPYNIGYAVSRDGIHFTPAQENPVITTTEFAWDDYCTYEPGVAIDDDGRIQLWFNGVRRSGGRDNARHVAAIAYAVGYIHGAPTDRLVCHWALDESGGSAVEDSSGLGHRAENRGALPARPGATPNTGTSYEFDGSGAHIWAHHPPILGQGSFTVGCYVRPEDLARRQILVSKWNIEGMFEHQPSHEWRLLIDAGGRLGFEVALEGEGKEVARCVSSVPLTKSMWQHVQAEYSQVKGTLALLVDGSSVAESSLARGRHGGRSIVTLGATRNGVSKDTADMADFFKGGLDDVRIHSYAISVAKAEAGD